MKEANDTKLRTTFIQGKNKVKDRLWKLIIVAEEPEDITAVDDEMYNDMSAQVRESMKNHSQNLRQAISRGGRKK